METTSFESIIESILLGFSLVFTYWWAYLPILLLSGFFIGRQHYVNEKYLDSLDWVLLKIKPPAALDRTLKAVEQVFAGLHGVYISPLEWKDRFFRGKISDWFSLEIVGSEGVTDFYIRTLSQYRNIVESNIFAQYPDVEISEAQDYMNKWPRSLPNQDTDLFGMELLLAKEDAYPIRTYLYFEEKLGGPEQLKRIDNLASISEIFSTFKPGEDFVMQILTRPVPSDGWTKKAQGVLDKLLGKEPKKQADFMESMFKSVDSIFLGGAPETKEETKEKKLSAPEIDQVKAIGEKISKLGFETSIRLAYIAKKEIFHRHHFAAIMGGLKQLAAVNLNSFKPNSKTITYSKGRLPILFPSNKGWFAEQLAFEKKWRLFRNLRLRIFPKKYFIFNTEELATVFHLPGLEVKAPLFPRVEAKKGQPPSGLPLE